MYRNKCKRNKKKMYRRRDDLAKNEDDLFDNIMASSSGQAPPTEEEKLRRMIEVGIMYKSFSHLDEVIYEKITTMGTELSKFIRISVSIWFGKFRVGNCRLRRRSWEKDKKRFKNKNNISSGRSVAKLSMTIEAIMGSILETHLAFAFACSVVIY